jgi:Divergent InlB B-repeat domain
VKRLTVLLAALGALLAVTAAPAYAVEELPFKETFGSAEQPSLGEPAGMAVDPASGDLYAIDLSDHTLHRYKPNGEADPFSALSGSNVIDGASGPDATPQGEILSEEGEGGGYAETEVAIAPPGAAGGTAGDIYVTDAFNEVVDVFAPSGEYIGQEALGYGCGVAVDPAGNVFVGDYYGSVHKLTPSAPGSFTETGTFSSVEPCQVAAATGFVYAVQFSDGAGHKIDSEGAEEGETKYTVATGVSNVAIDPESGELFTTTPNIAAHPIRGYDVSGAGEATLTTSTPLAAAGRGVTVDPSGNLYVTKDGSSNVAVYSLPEEEGGPTNKRTLTLTKSPDPAGGTGQGSVQSKPKGIKCGFYCEEAVAQMYLETPVELKEKPGKTSSFVEWSNPGGPCDESTAETCEVPMAEDEEVEAVFTGTSKLIDPAEGLTVEKAGDGEGTVKGTGGLGCEALCASTEVSYQGPITEPKPKSGKKVTLKQTPAFGSAFVGWEGCDEEVEGNCIVVMEEDLTVVAEYEALPTLALTVDKTYASGNGSVQSKPKGIKCGAYCTQAVADMPEGGEVLLKAKPGKETLFVEWIGGDCDESTALECTVTMDAAETTEAVFSKPSKALKEESEATLTLAKAGSGFGTVKAAGGLGCEWLCTSTSVVYQGPVALPKPKPGKTVVLKAYPAPGSKPVEWEGCTPISAIECEIEMDEGHTVTATFEELE